LIAKCSNRVRHRRGWAGGVFLNPLNWVTRYRVQRPFSRRLRIASAPIATGAASPALARFAADPGFDPLSGAIDFLLATYAGDAPRARSAMTRLDGTISPLFAGNDFRKLVVGCFRHALETGRLDRDKATLLLDFAERFDPTFAALGRRCPRRDATPKILSFDYAKRLSSRLRIVLLFGPSARVYDLGERLRSAFATAEVECRVLPGETDSGEIGANDLVLVDENTIFRKEPEKQQAHLDRLRKVAKRLGRLVPDPWGKGFDEQLARGADRYDFFWAMAPTLHETAPIPPGKICLIPFPMGFGPLFDEVAAGPPPEAGLGFCGAIEDYNHHRYFWLLSELARGSDLAIRLTSQQPDGLGIAESYRRYLQALLGTAACLSLTMRSTGDRIQVGRTFDVLRGERLLVQEYTPDALFYLAPGEDFIEVDGAADLPEVHERIRSGALEPVRRHGAETFRRAYSDEAVIRHLATWT